MRTICFLVVVFLSGAKWPGSPAFAEDFVWRVRGAGGTMYLGGSVHELRAQDQPLPASFEFAYTRSGQVAFEADLDTAAGGQFQAQVLAKARYAGGTKLASVLDAATYARVRSFASAHGLGGAFFGPYHPWLAADIIATLTLQDAGFREVHGVDRSFLNRAIIDGKPRLFLESVTEQVDLLAGVPEAEAILSLRRALDSEVADALAILDAWRVGDVAALDGLTEADRASAPASFDRLLVQRNRRWLPQLMAYLAQPKVTFVMVGAAHLGGTNGLVQLLANQGYELHQLPRPAPVITNLAPSYVSPTGITNNRDPALTDSMFDSFASGSFRFNFGSRRKMFLRAVVGD